MTTDLTTIQHVHDNGCIFPVSQQTTFVECSARSLVRAVKRWRTRPLRRSISLLQVNNHYVLCTGISAMYTVTCMALLVSRLTK